MLQGLQSAQVTLVGQPLVHYYIHKFHIFVRLLYTGVGGGEGGGDLNEHYYWLLRILLLCI